MSRLQADDVALEPVDTPASMLGLPVARLIALAQHQGHLELSLPASPSPAALLDGARDALATAVTVPLGDGAEPC